MYTICGGEAGEWIIYIIATDYKLNLGKVRQMQNGLNHAEEKISACIKNVIYIYLSFKGERRNPGGWKVGLISIEVALNDWSLTKDYLRAKN